VSKKMDPPIDPDSGAFPWRLSLRLKDIRKGMGLTQKQAAKLAKISPSQVSRLENMGRDANVGFMSSIRYLWALGWKMDIGGEGKVVKITLEPDDA